MPRYVNMLATGMKERGHQVQIWTPRPLFFNLPFNRLKKWLGYIDQYVIFPRTVRKQMRGCNKQTLFVFTDQAQGPWIPLAVTKPHVIHCHDFLSQISLSDDNPRNRLGITGRIYQRYIRAGLSKGKNFITVSQKTQLDLKSIGVKSIEYSDVVYNGVSESFKQSDVVKARSFISSLTGYNLTDGYILNVGSNLWYKNRLGVIEIYERWTTLAEKVLPIIMVGEGFTPDVLAILSEHPKLQVIPLSNLSDMQLQQLYSGAIVLLFPSLAEGFGWPIAEALTCGCPVITTNQAPMTEVGGNFGTYISSKPFLANRDETWELEGANAINSIVNLSQSDREVLISKGVEHAKQFNKEIVLEKVETIYKKIVHTNL